MTITYDVVQYNQTLAKLLEAEKSFVVVTLASIRGSAPQVVGAKCVVTSDGIESGTIGGGAVEAAAIIHAQKLLSDKSPPACSLETWNLQTDIGMTCGGEVGLLFEVHCFDSWHIAVFGAGHVAQALVPLLLNLRCQVTCVDPRRDWLERLPLHSRLNKICCNSPEDEVAGLPENAFFVLVSKGHATDLPVLRRILTTRDAPYVGVIGSAQKAAVLRRELAADGLPASKTDAFFCPMGLPLGNNTPGEIAVSIAAQLIQERDRLNLIQHKTKQF